MQLFLLNPTFHVHKLKNLFDFTPEVVLETLKNMDMG